MREPWGIAIPGTVLESDGGFLYPEAGMPQGGVASPILANRYPHDGLDLWFEGVVKPHGRGKALIIRYPDVRSRTVRTPKPSPGVTEAAGEVWPGGGS
jgi:hypothetical protein